MKNLFIKIVFVALVTTSCLYGNTRFNEAPKSITAELVVKSNSFCVAIVKGDLETVKKLVEYGEDVNQVSNGMTPLMYAAKYNRIDIVKFLVSKGAEVKTKSNKGLTALKYAQSTNAKEVVAYLEEVS